MAPPPYGARSNWGDRGITVEPTGHYGDWLSRFSTWLGTAIDALDTGIAGIEGELVTANSTLEAILAKPWNPGGSNTPILRDILTECRLCSARCAELVNHAQSNAFDLQQIRIALTTTTTALQRITRQLDSVVSILGSSGHDNAAGYWLQAIAQRMGIARMSRMHKSGM